MQRLNTEVKIWCWMKITTNQNLFCVTYLCKRQCDPLWCFCLSLSERTFEALCCSCASHPGILFSLRGMVKGQLNQILHLNYNPVPLLPPFLLFCYVKHIHSGSFVFVLPWLPDLFRNKSFFLVSLFPANLSPSSLIVIFLHPNAPVCRILWP